MWRALAFLALLAVAATAAVWLADRPGTVTIVWGGYEVATSLAAAVSAVIAAAIALALLWTLVRALLRLPRSVGQASRSRRRAQGYSAVSQGMVAVGSGDAVAARRHAGEAERLLGGEPLALLLKAQAAQISGDRGGAERAFRRMADEEETRVLGLRGLFVEARRRGDEGAARAYAAEASRLAPGVGWANEVVLEAQCASGDWNGALDTVERRATLGLLDKATARRHRAVLLTADALAREAGEPERALAGAEAAVKIAPDLVPAAALAGRLLSRRGDLKRAARIVEAAWQAGPHPDLARTYLDLRQGDSARDRLARAESLARLSSWAPEARFAIAEAAAGTGEFARARDALRPLAEGGAGTRPSVRTCLLMARLEEIEHGTGAGRAREWLARAAHAPRDPAWVADGRAFEAWAPVSPVSGRLDAFAWETPPEVVQGPSLAYYDAAGTNLDGFEPAPAAPLPPPSREAEDVADGVGPRGAAVPASAAPSAATPAPSAGVAAAAPDPAKDRAEGSIDPAAAPAARPPMPGAPTTPVIFPVAHAPDDPGPDGASASRSRLFG